MEKYCDAKPVIVNYECDICHNGLLVTVEHEAVKTDDGIDMVYTHRCPNCGATKEIINMAYPITKFIPIGNLRDTEI